MSRRDNRVEAYLTVMAQHLLASSDEKLDVCMVFTQSRQVNAFAAEFDSPRFVLVTSALFAFLENDSQLAAVLSHELAHILLGHRKKFEEAHEAASRSWFPWARRGKYNAAQRRLEFEADQRGVALVSRAGYDALGGAAAVANLSYGRTAAPSHPAFAPRVDALEGWSNRAPPTTVRPERVFYAIRALGY